MPPRSPRSRGSQIYAKPALTHADLLAQARDRGLVIPDQDRALRYLRHVGYYRLSPYLIPFRARPEDELLRTGTTFDDVLDLYVFDRRLRLLVMDALERIEVSVRSALTDYMSVTYNDPFWYLDQNNFRRRQDHAEFLKDLRKLCRRRLTGAPEPPDGDLVHRSALEHYLTTYGEPELPPSWLMVETLSLGQLQRLVDNLKRVSDIGGVGRQFNLPAPLLRSWLRTYVRVRNICAHHGRLWNVGLGVYPALPETATVPWLADRRKLTDAPSRQKRLYPVLVSLQSMMSVVSPGSSWARRLSTLLEQHDTVPLRGMGIPEDWRDDRFWSSRITG